MSFSLIWILSIQSLFYPLILADEEQARNKSEGDYGILNSFKNLTDLAIKEEHIFHLANERLKIVKKEIRMLEDYIEDYAETTGKAVSTAKVPVDTKEERARLIASSGITIYRMIYRFTKHLRELGLIYSEVEDNPLAQFLMENISLDEEEKPENRKWPNVVDLNNAIQSFLHVQETLDLSFSDMAQILSPETDPIELNAFHAAQIGLFALHEGFYDMAVEWIEFCMTKLLDEGDLSIPLVVVENYLSMVIKAHNEAFTRLPNSLRLFRDKIEKGQEPFSRVKRRSIYLQENKIIRDLHTREGDFWELCSGNNIKSRFPSQGKLNCYYDTKVHPLWIIGPQKIEELSHSPKIIQIHDMITEKEIENLLSISENRLERSKTIKINVVEASSIRTSVGIKLETEETLNFTRKLQDITGLETMEDESELSITQYVFGRRYRFHLDATNDPTEEIGNRLATLLIYLNDVGSGGSTPFVDLGIAIPPLKGSGIFWYNFYRNGTLRIDTHHGACPVLYGHKIVIQRWFHIGPQFHTFKCSLNTNE